MHLLGPKAESQALTIMDTYYFPLVPPASQSAICIYGDNPFLTHEIYFPHLDIYWAKKSFRLLTR